MLTYTFPFPFSRFHIPFLTFLFLLVSQFPNISTEEPSFTQISTRPYIQALFRPGNTSCSDLPSRKTCWLAHPIPLVPTCLSSHILRLGTWGRTKWHPEAGLLLLLPTALCLKGTLGATAGMRKVWMWEGKGQKGASGISVPAHQPLGFTVAGGRRGRWACSLGGKKREKAWGKFEVGADF